MENIQPIVPEGTPLPTPPVGVPPFPITPFAVWTWSTPVIPEFYWNVYSAEQRIKMICKEIGKIEAYLNYLVNKTNENIIELHNRIDELTERVAALEKHVEEEIARLDALIAQLRADLEQEIADREAGDTALGERIDQEILDRTHGDQTLHEEIAQEVQDRTHADDQLHTEISTETQDRIHADDQLHEEISHRLLPTDLQAGAEIEITRPDPNSNTIVIASTVSHSLAELQALVSGLQAALTSETAERRADDATLWAAVNQRIERGKILAGPGIRVDNDPDASTVTISATGGGTGGGSTTVAGTAPVEVTGDPEEGYTIGVAAATESEAGVITEARVKELTGSGSGITINGELPLDVVEKTPGTYNLGLRTEEPLALDDYGNLKINSATSSKAGIISEARVREIAGTVAPSLSAEEPLKIEGGAISVSEITPETESETETGVVSKRTIQDLARYSGAVNSQYGLTNDFEGGLRVKLAPYAQGGNSYPGLGFTSAGALGFSQTGLIKDSKKLEYLRGSSPDLFPSGKPAFLMDLGSPDALAPLLWLARGFFEVQPLKSSSWEKAEAGAFELYIEQNDTELKYATLYARATPYGASYYGPEAEAPEGTLWGISAVRVAYAAWPVCLQAPSEIA